LEAVWQGAFEKKSVRAQKSVWFVAFWVKRAKRIFFWLTVWQDVLRTLLRGFYKRSVLRHFAQISQTAPPTLSLHMNPEEYERMHELETHYWWFVGRRGIVRTLLQQTVPLLPSRAPRLVDIGCGTGANLPMLRRSVGEAGSVVGLDFSPLALAHAREELAHLPDLGLSQGDAMQLPLRDQSADCVTMLDVLEHLRDDKCALSEVARVLKPGGALILTVPAYQHLWSAHDEALHHFRRYEKHELRARLREADLRVEKLSFAMSLLPPAAYIWRHLVLPRVPRRPRDAQRHSQGAVLPQLPPLLNAAMIRMIELEGRVLLKRPLRFGTSLVALAWKR
jgi:ubiquinone/menaquinone biosynthesis C-methylase UbiE